MPSKRKRSRERAPPPPPPPPPRAPPPPPQPYPEARRETLGGHEPTDRPVPVAEEATRHAGPLRRELARPRAAHDAAAREGLLVARAITKRFGGLTAVDGMDITVRRGEIVGLIGPNGAGKTTFFNVLCGFYPPTAGEVYFEGRRITNVPDHRVARLGLGRTFQLTRSLSRLTVLENLMLAPKNQTGEKLWALFLPWVVRKEEAALRERAEAMLASFGLTHLKDEYAGALSGGQKKLVDLARALMLEPRMLLLDEPMAGVNPTLAKKLIAEIRRLRDERNVTILMVEHDMETVFNNCDRVVVMAEGRKLREGTPDEIRADRAVIDAYLGG